VQSVEIQLKFRKSMPFTFSVSNNKQESSVKQVCRYGLLLRLFFYLEDADDIFLRNVG
jgi:hypothetical protein